MIEDADPAAATHGRRSVFANTSALLIGNLAIAVTGLITAPLQARALEPSGRGELAAIVAPLALLTFVVGFGQPEYATRMVARGRRSATVLGSLYPIILVSSIVSAVGLWFLAPTLADGSEKVESLLRIGALLLPVAGLGTLFTGIASGQSRFDLVGVCQCVSAATLGISIGVLYVVGALTVQTAVAATLAAGIVPLFIYAAVLRPGAPRFERGLALAGSSFGARAWLGAIALAVNARIDQVLMVALTTSTQLGLYVVAVTFATLPALLVAPLANAIVPRVSTGDAALVAKACRVSLAGTVLAGAVIAALAYPALRIFFGQAFTSAYPMLLVLVGAQAFAAVSTVVGFSLRTSGRPGIVSLAEIVALAVTLPGVFLLVPPLGGLGAALVSVAAYGLSSCVLFAATLRHFGGPAAQYLVLRRADVTDAYAQLTRQLRRPRSRPAHGPTDGP